MRNLPIRKCVIILAALSMSFGAARGANVILNGDFSLGLDDWLLVGDIFNTGQQGVLTEQTESRAILWQAVVLPPGMYTLEFDLLTGLGPVGGTGTLPDTFFASLYFFTDPLAFDPIAPANYTQALAIADLDISGVTALGENVTMGPSPKGTSYQHFVFPFTVTSGQVVPVFDLSNLNFAPGDSVAAVDNVTINIVPEPGTAAYFLLASSACLVRRNRQRSI